MAWQITGSWTFTNLDEFVGKLKSDDFSPESALGLMYPSMPGVEGGAVVKGSEVEAYCSFVGQCEQVVGKCEQDDFSRVWGAWFPFTVDVVTYVEMVESETGNFLGKWVAYGDAVIFPGVVRYTMADIARTDGKCAEVRGPKRS